MIGPSTMFPSIDENALEEFEVADPPHRPAAFQQRRARTKRGTLSISWADAELLEAVARKRSTAWQRVTYMTIVQELVSAHCKAVREEATAKKPTAKKPTAKKPTAKKPTAKKPGGRR